MDQTGPGPKPGAIIAGVRAQVLRDGSETPYDDLRGALDALPQKVRRRPPWLRTSILLNLAHHERDGQTRLQLTKLRDRLRAKGREQDFDDFWALCVARLAPYSLGPHGYHRSLASVDSAELWVEIDRLVQQIRAYGAEVFLDSGTLLGVIRDGDFVAHDDDVDLGVLVPGDDPTSVAAGWRTLRAHLAEQGLLDPEFEARGFLHTKARTSTGIGIDLFPAWVLDECAWVWPHTAGDLPADRLLPLGTLETGGHTQRVPRDPEALLERNYGSTWRTPDPLWSFDWEGAKTRFTEMRDLMLGSRPGAGPRRVVVHCGTYKAGSSAIQDWAWQHRDDLLAAGILYPRAGLNLHEPDVGVRHAPLAWQHREDRGRWDAMVDELVAELRDSTATTVLLSAEAWSRPEHVDSLGELLGRLREEGLVGSAEGVVYLRNRLDHARRMYREVTRRRGNVRRFAEWMADDPASLDTLDVLDRLAPLLDRLEVVPYDEVPDTARHLSALLGSSYDQPAPRSNPGLDVLETEAIRRLRLRAPQLLDAWPGLAAAVPPELSLDPHGFEEVAAAAPPPDPAWRTRFTGRTGWDDARMDAYLDTGHAGRRDVGEVSDLLDGVVVGWLRSGADLDTEVRLPPSTWVATVELEPLDAARDRQALRGRITLRPDAPAITLVAVSDAGEHQERPRDGSARFVVASVSWGAGSRIELVAEEPDGHRTLIAQVSRAWRPRD